MEALLKEGLKEAMVVKAKVTRIDRGKICVYARTTRLPARQITAWVKITSEKAEPIIIHYQVITNINLREDR